MARGILSTTVPDHSFKQNKNKKKSKKRKTGTLVSEIEGLNAIVSALIRDNLSMAIALNQICNLRQTQDNATCVTPALVATVETEEGGKNP